MTVGQKYITKLTVSHRSCVYHNAFLMVIVTVISNAKMLFRQIFKL